MYELGLQDVSMEINKTTIASKLSFCVKGLCSVLISPNCGDFKEVLLLFSKTHLYSENDVKIEGAIYFEGKMIPAAKFHHLLNQHVIFEGNDIVFGILWLINKEEAESIIKNLDIQFSNKRTDHLSIQESSIFEFAVNIAAKPPVMYLKTLGMTQRQRNKCLLVLRECIKKCNSVALVETEFSEIFDSAIIMQNNKMLSLNKQEAMKFFKTSKLAIFDLPSKAIETLVETENFKKTEELYDYKKLFEKYKTQNLVDLKHKTLSVWNRLTTFDFYKLNLSQSILLGYRKYEMAFQKYERRYGVIKSLAPSFLIILLLRIFDELTDISNAQHIPGLISAMVCAFFDKNQIPSLIFFFMRVFVLKDLSMMRISFLLKKFFRENFSKLGQRLIFASVCFSITYHYSSSLEEDSQALNYTLNVLLTPGTYIASIFIFTFLAHITIFCFLGWIFNIKYMAFNLICVFFTNLICFGFLGKRLRTTFMGFLIAISLFTAIWNLRNPYSFLMHSLIYLMFPSLLYAEGLADGSPASPIPFPFYLCYLVFYSATIYIITCYRLSFY